ncbi:MAG: zinc metallopeptidase [Hyphomicrobiaceae bacterium]
MGALFVVLILAFGLALLPQMWVKSVLRRHATERPEFPGTGGEFARHLLDEMKLTHVKVEETTTLGDHYDPEAKVVRLMPQHFDGRSLSAVVVAAHEVGHAMQDATDYRPLQARTRMAKQARSIERFGMAVMLATPIAMLVFKSPHVVVMELFLGMLILGSTVVMHAMTLPVELDASFRRALPVLKAGRYIGDHDLASARQILRAAAFTYVAAAAMSLLDVARWLRLLRL